MIKNDYGIEKTDAVCTAIRQPTPAERARKRLELGRMAFRMVPYDWRETPHGTEDRNEYRRERWLRWVLAAYGLACTKAQHEQDMIEYKRWIRAGERREAA